jgi:hypothetical protein
MKENNNNSKVKREKMLGERKKLRVGIERKRGKKRVKRETKR